jgi:CoA:oxalate CoA-transferase
MKQRADRNERPRMPLEGVRVVSLEQIVAGPCCSMILADRGAEVIKIEQVGTGDPTRGSGHLAPWYLEKDGKRMSQEYFEYNRSKKSVTLNLQTQDGQEILKRLIKTADVFIENLRPGVMKKWGIERKELKELNPRLIHCVISGFGLTGPYANWPALDPVVQALGGFADRLGAEEGPPCLAPLGFSDMLTSLFAAFAIAEALFLRGKTQEGAFVDISMYDCVVFFSERSIRYYAFNNALQPRGKDVYSAYGIFRAGDGRYLSFYVSTDRMWKIVCKAIGREDLINALELEDVPSRSRNLDTRIVPVLEEWARNKTAKEAFIELMEAGAPVGIVQTAEEVYNCEHVRARNMLVEIDEAVYGKKKLPRTPIKTENYENVICTHPPQLGENNTEVYGQLGYTDDQLRELRSKGVI